MDLANTLIKQASMRLSLSGFHDADNDSLNDVLSFFIDFLFIFCSLLLFLFITLLLLLLFRDKVASDVLTLETPEDGHCLFIRKLRRCHVLLLKDLLFGVAQKLKSVKKLRGRNPCHFL